jgi:hypothetical protein
MFATLRNTVNKPSFTMPSAAITVACGGDLHLALPIKQNTDALESYRQHGAKNQPNFWQETKNTKHN